MPSSNLLNLPHFDNSAFASSKLSAEVSAGDDSLPVESVNGFGANKLILVDDLGTERAEIAFMDVAPIVSDLVLSSGLVKGHGKGAPVMVMPYDQVVIYRATGSTEPAEGSFSSILATIDMDVESDFTLYEDASPPTNAWYKWKYQNSETAALSGFAAPTLQYAAKFLYATPQEVMADLGQTHDSARIARLIESICDIIDSEIQRGGRLYYRSVTEVFDMIANGHKYFPKHTPVVSVETVEVLGSDGVTWEEVENIVAHAYPTRIEFDTPFRTTRRKALRFTYTAGFFDKEAIPAMLNEYVRDLAARWYKEKKSGRRSDVKAKRIGSYSVTYKDDAYAGSLRDEIKDSDVVAHFSKGWSFGALQSGIQSAATGNSSVFDDN